MVGHQPAKVHKEFTSKKKKSPWAKTLWAVWFYFFKIPIIWYQVMFQLVLTRAGRGISVDFRTCLGIVRISPRKHSFSALVTCMSCTLTTHLMVIESEKSPWNQQTTCRLGFSLALCVSFGRDLQRYSERSQSEVGHPQVCSSSAPHTKLC